MKLAVFGANGPTGRLLTQMAVNEDHDVVAFTRCPDTFPIRHPRLAVAGGDVHDPSAVSTAIDGADAVISTLGVPFAKTPINIYSYNHLLKPNHHGGDTPMSHVVRAEAESSAPIETVWQLLSTVDTWPTWSRHKLARLERDGSPTPDGMGAIRVLGVNPSKPTKCNREEVVAFDAPTHFGYTLLSGQPLEDYRSDVRLSALPGGGTRITWESRFATHGPTGWFWKMVIRWVLKHWSTDLAKGAERLASAPDVQRSKSGKQP